MSDNSSGPEKSSRPDLPFPTRKELHSSRIPQAPVGVPAPPSKPVTFPSRSELHRTGQIPQVQPHHQTGQADEDGKGDSPAQKPKGQKPKGQKPEAQRPEAAPERVGRSKRDKRSEGGQPQKRSTPVNAAGKAEGPLGPLNGGGTLAQRSAPSDREGRSAKGARAAKRRRSRLIRSLVVVALLAIVVGVAGYFALNNVTPEQEEVVDALNYPGPGAGQVDVTIVPGATGEDIGQELVDAGVVKSVAGFKQAFNNNSAAATIKPGTYSLKLEMTSAGALAVLLDEASRQDNAVTVVPGQTKGQVAEKLVQVGGFSKEEVEQAYADAPDLGLPEVAGSDVEGWLAPGAYEVAKDATAADVVAEMIRGTVKELEGLEVPEDDWQAVLTKASILEREVISESDLPKVARVIENRLEDKDSETRGLLQMDSTVLYGVGRSGGLPTEEDLSSDTPYNTYTKAGLPPTPIGSPSTAAIQAILNPDEGDWLYFVTVNLDTGETKFASTLDEHTRNTQLLEDWCEANPGKC